MMLASRGGEAPDVEDSKDARFQEVSFKELEVGQAVRVRATSVDVERGHLAVSMRLPFDKLKVGQKYTGVVRALRGYGAFVDIGAERDGLLHLSGVAEERVDNIGDYLKVGQEVQVWVKEISGDGKLEVTMVKSKVPSKLEVGQRLTGTVRSILDYGAFVDVGAERNGLLSISNVAEQRVDDIRDYLKVGQEVQVWVRVVQDDGKFDLTMVNSKLPFDLEVGQKLTGTVKSIHDYGAWVDVGAQKNGLLSIGNVATEPTERIDDLHDYLQVGQEVQVWVRNVRDDGAFELTMREGKSPRQLEIGQKLAGIVRRLQDFGAFVDVGAVQEGFLPPGNVANERIDDIRDYLKVGQEIQVWVKNVSDNGKFELTMMDRTLPGQLQVGQKLTGTVRSIHDYGAFVDVGAQKSGLLSIGNVATEPTERIDDLHDYLQVGQEVQVWVRNVRDDGDFELTMREGKSPRQLEVGQKLAGTVRSLYDYGAFVDVGAVREGFLNIRNVANERIDDIRDYLKVGQEVQVWVKDVSDNGKFELTMMDRTLPGQLQVGQKLTGTVRSIHDYGAFVDVGATKSGLLSIGNLANERIDDIHDCLQVGQEVHVWVRTLRDDGDFELTMREGKSPSQFEVGQELVGTVRSLYDYGAFVDVGAVSEGFLHISAVADKRIDDIHDYLRVGQEVGVRVAEVRDDGKLDLTMREGEGSAADISAFAGVPPDLWLDASVARLTPSGVVVSVSPPGGGAAQDVHMKASLVKGGALEDRAAVDAGPAKTE